MESVILLFLWLLYCAITGEKLCTPTIGTNVWQTTSLCDYVVIVLVRLSANVTTSLVDLQNYDSVMQLIFLIFNS